MKLNQKVRYGLECLFELASTPTEYTDGDHIATARGIPSAYAQKILSALAQYGLIYSMKGQGYRLARPLEDITALEVIKALDQTAPVAEHPLERRILAALEGVSLETLKNA